MNIINAVSGTGITQTADGSGQIKLQANGVTTNALAWVNFNGTLSGTITPRANYNCSSVTKNGTGDYTINFTTALSDANYAPAGMAQETSGQIATVHINRNAAPTTSALRISVWTQSPSATNIDSAYVCVNVLGN